MISEVNCIIFNRLLSALLLSKVAKYKQKSVISFNKYFSNYNQVPARPVFTQKVTYYVYELNLDNGITGIFIFKAISSIFPFNVKAWTISLVPV